MNINAMKQCAGAKKKPDQSRRLDFQNGTAQANVKRASAEWSNYQTEFGSIMAAKNRKPKRTYSEKEFKKAVKQVSDEAVSKILTLCVTAAADEFNLDEEGVVSFMERMERYVQYEEENKIKVRDAQNALKKTTGIDLRVTRW